MRRFILVQPVLDYSALQPGARASAAIRQASAVIGFDGDPRVRVRLTGPTPLDDSAEPIVKARRRHTFLRVASSGTAVHFDAKGIQRVYRCYSSRPQTAR